MPPPDDKERRTLAGFARQTPSLPVALVSAALLGACAHEPPPQPVAGRVPLPVEVTPPPPPVDPLGPMPVIGTVPLYVPPKPDVFTASNGLTVWLVERHTLPYVAVTMAVPTGASSDPKGEWGLAAVTADMLDEGAGTRGPIELSRAVDALGASLGTNANSDESRVWLTVLKKNLAPAFALFADVVARPRFDAGEWKRVFDIRRNDLLERQSDPDAVASVVVRAALFGDQPYGHPVEGTTESAKKWSLADVKRFYGQAWRPDRAVLVAVGDVTHEEIASLVDGSLAGWRAPAKAEAPSPLAPATPAGPWPRLVLVDRPDAPQSVIAVARPGVAASDPDAPVLDRANLALGVLFTSRLNQDLREEHGYSYGARSGFGVNRGVGAFIASASVITEKTGEALKAMMADLDAFARGGLTDAEFEKTRSHARADLVETFEGVDRVASQLAFDASLGLGPDYQRQCAGRKDLVAKAELDALVRAHFDPSHAVIVVVGPRAKVEEQARAAGFQDIEIRDTEGGLPKASAAKK